MKSHIPHKFVPLAAVLLLGGVLLACSKTPEPVSVPGGSPAIDVISPVNDSAINGNVDINLVVTNFALATAAGLKNTTGQGHLDFCITPAASPTNPPVQIPFFGMGNTCQMVSATYNVGQALTPGTYILTLSLVNNDDSNLSPPVTQSIQITVNGSGIHNVTLNITTQ